MRQSAFSLLAPLQSLRTIVDGLKTRSSREKGPQTPLVHPAYAFDRDIKKGRLFRRSFLRDGCKGFTLIEVIIAITLLSTSLIIITNITGGNLQKVRKGDVVSQATILLERKMVELESEYKERPVSEIPEEDAGEFKDQPGFTWQMSSREFTMPDLSSVLVSQQDGASETLLQVVSQMRDYFSKAVKEVEVVVIYKKPNSKLKPLKYNLVTYFVDYTQK